MHENRVESPPPHPVLAILTSFWTNIAYLQFLTSHFTVLGYISLKYLDALSPPVLSIIITLFFATSFSSYIDKFIMLILAHKKIYLTFFIFGCFLLLRYELLS